MAKKPILEMAVMDVLWSGDGWLTPRQVRGLLPEERKVAYTTVMTVLVRLCDKGRVVRRPEGRAFAYSAVDTREAYAATRMGEMLATASDRTSALGHFIEALTPDDRAELRDWLDHQ